MSSMSFNVAARPGSSSTVPTLKDRKLMPDVDADVFEALFDEAREFESKPPADVDGEVHEEEVGGGDTKMEIVAAGDPELLYRPCVDCGQFTGNFCEGHGRCIAAEKIPSEVWATGQHTPLCSTCEGRFGACHFCRKIPKCRPFAWGVPPSWFSG